MNLKFPLKLFKVPKLGIVGKVLATLILAIPVFAIFVFLLWCNGINPINLKSFIPDEVIISPMNDIKSLSDIAKIKSLRADALRNIVWAFGSSLGLFLALIGLINSLHRTQQKDREIINQEVTEKAARRVADSTLFSNGVTKLGAPEPEVQVGGLYELEFLAKEDFKYTETDNFMPIQIKSTIANFIKLKSTKTDNNARAAIQPAMLVLSRTFSKVPNSHDVDINRPVEADLLNLRNAVFTNLAFPSDMNFSGMDLTGANFENCRLIGAKFKGSNLNNVKFCFSDLTRSSMLGADATDADFRNSTLSDADFTETREINYLSIESSNTSLSEIQGLDKEIIKKVKDQQKKDKIVKDYYSNIELFDSSANKKVVDRIVKYCGAALSTRDGSLVACSDEAELQRIADGYLKKKLNIHPDDGMELVLQTCSDMKSQRFKSRVTFYYLLAKKANKLHVFAG